MFSERGTAVNDHMIMTGNDEFSTTGCVSTALHDLRCDAANDLMDEID